MRDAEALGADLRAARESRELSLAQAEQQTRIRAYYLEALESGSFDVLPSPVQGKGFLRNYSRLLGLDPEIMAARFDAALNQRGRRVQTRPPQAAPPVSIDSPRALPTRADPLAPRPDVTSFSQRQEVVPTVSRNPRRRRTPPTGNTAALAGADARRQRSRNTTLGTIAILLIALLALFGVIALSLYVPPNGDSSLFTPDTGQPTVNPNEAVFNPNATVDPGIGTDAVNSTPSPARPSPLPNPGTLQAASGNDGQINVQISVKRRVALTVYADGKQVALGVFGPENILQYQATTGVRIVCGNADAIEVTVNGQVVTDLGQSQQAIDRTFTGK